MIVWLSKQPSWGKPVPFWVRKRVTYKLVLVHTVPTSSMVTLEGDLAYLPSVSTTYSLWYKRRYMTITRTLQDTAGSYYSTQHTFPCTSLLTRSHSVLIGLLQEARKEYMAAQEHKMCVWVSDVNNSWRHVGCRAKRSMNSIILEPGVKDLLLEDARDFLDSKNWYAERGIPFRRGYLLYGVPGSGKTSLIHSIAGELGLDIYIISLSRVGLDDSSLDALINELPERCVALMEDIDAAFTRTLNRDDDNNSDSAGSSGSFDANKTPKKSDILVSRVSLSGLLNALDGIGAQEGRILFATTNKHTSLDPALCRPGRMDLHIEFRLSSKYQARELFKRFYIPSNQSEVEGDDDDETADSGYGGSPTPSEATDSTPPSPSGSNAPESPISESSSLLPAPPFSMATLQGYLMMHKTNPFVAVAGAKDWVEKELSDRNKREKKRKEKAEQEKKAKQEKEAKEKEAKEKGKDKDLPTTHQNPGERDKAIQVTPTQVSS
ncbi:P-loop containing nucleoside triphosphate hydrolase protein [Armillaria mellea]|nr:P-loop containing nucleoside triphosphate hydrolase protein [Armillaria mellea]